MKDYSDPAFPVPADVKERCEGHNQSVKFTGMSLRDYFAAHALAGVNATTEQEAARRAYEVADAMLAERTK